MLVGPVLVLLARVPRETERRPQQPFDLQGAVLLTMYTVLLSLPIFLVQDVGWGSAATGLLLTGLSVQMVVFSPLGGRLADAHGARLPAAAGAAAIVAGCCRCS